MATVGQIARPRCAGAKPLTVALYPELRPSALPRDIVSVPFRDVYIEGVVMDVMIFFGVKFMLKNALLCLALSTLTISAYSQQNYRQMGFDAYQAGDYRKAVEYLAKAVEENEGDKSAWLYLGASYVNLGKTSDARRTFNHWRKVKAMPGDNEPLTDEPLKITRNSAPTINEELRRSAIRPQARLLVEFKSDGKVGFVFILGNTTPEWERDVIDAAKRFRFEPAAKNGVPVTIVRLVEFDGPI